MYITRHIQMTSLNSGRVERDPHALPVGHLYR
jgi:hypothetical protein